VRTSTIIVTGLPELKMDKSNEVLFFFHKGREQTAGSERAAQHCGKVGANVGDWHFA
jgi:hypothetical protein